MDIDQEFANSANDPAIMTVINEYIDSRDSLPACNCSGTSESPCSGSTLRACRKVVSPNGGVYTKLDQNGGLGSEAFNQTVLDDMETNYNMVLSKITEKKIFIENPPDPQIPDLAAKMLAAKNDIDRMAFVLEELSFYITQLRIHLA